jgi:hypothetical protein
MLEQHLELIDRALMAEHLEPAVVPGETSTRPLT